MDESFCVECLEEALQVEEAPEIFNSGQGSQFTGKAFTGVLNKHEIKISMDGKGRTLDNVMIERLWCTMKYDDIHRSVSPACFLFEQSLLCSLRLATKTDIRVIIPPSEGPEN